MYRLRCSVRPLGTRRLGHFHTAHKGCFLVSAMGAQLISRVEGRHFGFKEDVKLFLGAQLAYFGCWVETLAPIYDFPLDVKS